MSSQKVEHRFGKHLEFGLVAVPEKEWWHVGSKIVVLEIFLDYFKQRKCVFDEKCHKVQSKPGIFGHHFLNISDTVYQI